MEFHLNGTTFIVRQPRDDDQKLIETCAVVSPWTGGQCMFPPGHQDKHGFKADPRGYEGAKNPSGFAWDKKGSEVTSGDAPASV